MKRAVVAGLIAVTAAMAQQTVDAVAVISMPVESRIELKGELQAFQQTGVRVPEQAQVVKVLVDRGSRVAEGDVLAVLTPGGELRAPFAGVITARYVHPGALMGPHDGPLFDLAQTSRLRLEIPVPEADAGTIPRGDVSFRVPAWPGSAFHGAIARNAGLIDPKTRTLAVEADVRNPGGRLLPGMQATVAWKSLSPRSVTQVPGSAITTSGKRTFVIRIRDGVAEWVDVVRGTAPGSPGGGNLVTVEGGLDAGDVIVRDANPQLLQPGTRTQARVR